MRDEKAAACVIWLSLSLPRFFVLSKVNEIIALYLSNIVKYENKLHTKQIEGKNKCSSHYKQDFLGIYTDEKEARKPYTGCFILFRVL
jgi:hypothetical protein